MYMYIHMYVYIYIYICTYTYICIYVTYVHRSLFTYVAAIKTNLLPNMPTALRPPPSAMTPLHPMCQRSDACIYSCLCERMRDRVCTCSCTCRCICVHVFVCVRVCMYACVYAKIIVCMYRGEERDERKIMSHN